MYFTPVTMYFTPVAMYLEGWYVMVCPSPPITKKSDLRHGFAACVLYPLLSTVI